MGVSPIYELYIFQTTTPIFYFTTFFLGGEKEIERVHIEIQWLIGSELSIFTLHVIDFYGKLLGKYTLHPMDPIWDIINPSPEAVLGIGFPY